MRVNAQDYDQQQLKDVIQTKWVIRSRVQTRRKDKTTQSTVCSQRLYSEGQHRRDLRSYSSSYYFENLADKTQLRNHSIYMSDIHSKFPNTPTQRQAFARRGPENLAATSLYLRAVLGCTTRSLNCPSARRCARRLKRLPPAKTVGRLAITRGRAFLEKACPPDSAETYRNQVLCTYHKQGSKALSLRMVMRRLPAPLRPFAKPDWTTLESTRCKPLDEYKWGCLASHLTVK
eukprot:6146786-Amphidinium_carterae.1